MSGIDIKCTEHDFWFRKRRLGRHMVHLSYVGCGLLRRSLLITLLTLGCLLILLLGAMISIMPNFSTTIAYVGVLGALVFMGVLLGVPCRRVC